MTKHEMTSEENEKDQDRNVMILYDDDGCIIDSQRPTSSKYTCEYIEEQKLDNTPLNSKCDKRSTKQNDENFVTQVEKNRTVKKIQTCIHCGKLCKTQTGLTLHLKACKKQYRSIE